jgi:hypothetical protein
MPKTDKQIEDQIDKHMDNWYTKWQNSDISSMKDMLDREDTTTEELISVCFGKLNQQVCNGGFSQWECNSYMSDTIDHILEWSEKGIAICEELKEEKSEEFFEWVFDTLTDMKNEEHPDDMDSYEEQWVDCEDCGGDGEVWDDDTEEYETCGTCNGKGGYDEDVWVAEDHAEQYMYFLDNYNDAYYAFDEKLIFKSIVLLLDNMNMEIAKEEEEIEPANSKPFCSLVGTDGNVLALAHRVVGALREAGQREKAREVREKLFDCQSYDHALQMFMDYVEIC